MIGLALDTSYLYASIVIIKSGELLYYANNSKPNKQAETINVMVKEGLSSVGIEFQDLRYVAVAVGPGRFTGLKVGISVANAIHFALKTPLLPISNFEAIAYSYKNKKIGIVLGAGVGKFYFQSFDCCKSISDISIVIEDEVVLLREKYFLIGNVDIVDNQVVLDARDIANYADYKSKRTINLTSSYIKPQYIMNNYKN